MKLEPLVERPIVTSAWQARPGVRQSSPMLDTNDIISSLATKVSKMHLQSEILGLDEELAKLSLKQTSEEYNPDPKLNVTENKEKNEKGLNISVANEEDKESKVVCNISVLKEEEKETVATDIKDTGNEKKKKVLDIVTTKDGEGVKETDFIPVKEEKDEEGVLHPRSPMRRDQASVRSQPYQQIQSSYNQQNVGQCTVREADDYVRAPTQDWYQMLNICGDENDFESCVNEDVFPSLAGATSPALPSFSDSCQFQSSPSPNNFTPYSEQSSPLTNFTSYSEQSSPLTDFTSYSEQSLSPSNNYTSYSKQSLSPPNNYTSYSEQSLSPPDLLTPTYTDICSPCQPSLEDEIQTDPVSLDELLSRDDFLDLDKFTLELVKNPIMQGALEECIRDEVDNGDNIPTTVAEFSSPDNSPPPHTPSDLGYYSSRSTDTPSPRDSHIYTAGYGNEESNSCVYPGAAYIQDTSADSFSTKFSHVVAIRSPESFIQPSIVLPTFSRPVPTTATRILQPKPQCSVLPAATARLKDKLNEGMKTNIWTSISLRTDDELTSADEDGDTHLMVLIADPKVRNKLEIIYAIVERFKKIQRGLTSVNHQGYSVLELTALFYRGADRALITRYIAESLVHIGSDVNTLNNDGDSLLHVLCKEGDAHTEVLAELLAVKDCHGRLAFDLDKYNRQGRTPVQEAVVSHGQVKQRKGKDVAERIRSVATLHLLMRSGANTTLLTLPDNKNLLRLAITSSCDDALLATLLADASLVHASQTTSYREDTCLHLVAARNDLTVDQQGRCYKMLVERGWGRGVANEAGRLPLDLVDRDRREEIRNICQKR